MRLIQIAVANVDPTVGAIRSNVDRMPAQAAEDELMPFPDLDAGKLDGWEKRFATLFSRSIYKWVQSPLALHVGSLDLDRERALQLPLVQRNEWSG